MGFRTWMYKKTGVKLKKIKEKTIVDERIRLENFTGPRCYMHETSITGKHTYVGDSTKIFSNVIIGSFCSIASDVIIAPYSHPIEWLSSHPFQFEPVWNTTFGIKCIDFDNSQETVIKNDVWIGAMALIKKGVTIGNGAIIGSCSVVTKDVPDYAIVVGNPAKIIRYRFSQDIIDKLLKLEWWNIPVEKLNNITFDNIDIAIKEIIEIKKSI